MRRLLFLTGAIIFVDTLFFAALTPLLPHYADTLGLGKTGAGVLAAATGVVLVVSLAVTALSFTPASWPVFIAGNLLVGLTYACIGALAGSALGQLGATYLVLFLAMLGIGILQDPMFGDGTPGGLAYAFPDYGAGRVSMDGAFSAGFQTWTELALALGWLAVLGTAVTWVLRRLLRSTA